jgi:hypothetical protein
MDANELAKKPPMAMPGFTTITPKSETDGRAETDYEKKIQKELEKRMTDCCDGYSPHDYDRYGYKPRPSASARMVAEEGETADAGEQSPATPVAEPQHVPQPDKKNSKR